MSDQEWTRASSGGRPGVCRSCGAIVAAGESVCPQCGAPLALRQPQAVSRQAARYDHETMRFARAILSRPYLFTIVFLSANFFVFLLMWEHSGLSMSALWEFDLDTLLRFGAKLNALIDTGDEWWRFVTPVFIHAGILHLLFNMYGLWILGPYVERLYGSAKFVVFWVVTGVAGVVASYFAVRPSLSHGLFGRFLFRPGDGPSVGASGALFGLIGVLFVFGIKYRHELPEGFKRAFGTGMLPTILLNLFIGLTIPVIDNAAHLGGLLAGAGLALVTDYKRPGRRGTVAYFWHLLQILCLGLVITSFVLVAKHFKEPLEQYIESAALSNAYPGTTVYLKAINDGQQELGNALTKGDISGIDHAITELEQAPVLDPVAGQLRDELRNLLVAAKQLHSIDQARTGVPKAQEERLVADYESWITKRDDWVKANGKRYGIKLTDDEKQDSK